MLIGPPFESTGIFFLGKMDSDSFLAREWTLGILSGGDTVRSDVYNKERHP